LIEVSELDTAVDCNLCVLERVDLHVEVLDNRIVHLEETIVVLKLLEALGLGVLDQLVSQLMPQTLLELEFNSLNICSEVGVLLQVFVK